MRKMFNKIALAVLGISIISCNNWLDVDSDTNVKSEVLFDDYQGFHTAVNGVYRLLGAAQLYGRDLTWGVASIIGNNYNEAKLPTEYASLVNYAYDENNNSNLIDPIWEQGYSVIANCNNIIANVVKRDSSFFPEKQVEKDVILGEMLGVRAMMHFDLLRLFAPAPATKPNGKYIPYVTVYPSHMTEHLTVEATLDSIIRDLELAKNLLAYNDTLYNRDYMYNRRIRLEYGGTFFSFRGLRMNFFAATAILGRVYLWRNAEGDKQKALRCANDMYRFSTEQNWFAFTDYWDLETEINSIHRKMPEDILFAGYNDDLYNLYALTKNMGTFFAFKNYNGEKDLFGNEVDDFRYRKLIETDGTSRRWAKPEDESTANAAEVLKYQGPLAPVIRMSEVYYTMCECLAETDLAQAKSILGTVRLARGVNQPLADELGKDEFLEILYIEMTREFMSEGQTFFLYKRLNRPIYNGAKPLDMTGRYVLPIPHSEDAYSKL